MDILWTDFETRSECDLPARGAYNYARDPSTEVLCLAWAIDDEDVALWTPATKMPERLAKALLTYQVRAHNAAFERLILWYVLGIDTPLEHFYCTAAEARANCAPGKLEDVGRFIGAGMRKDHRGAQLVRKCCIPPFKHTAEDLQGLFDYCLQDVRAMRAISKAMRPLSAVELEDYHVAEEINDRGAKVDRELCQAAVRYAEDERKELESRALEIVGSGVTSLRSGKLRDWVYARVGPTAKRMMTTYKDNVKKVTIDKSARANLMLLGVEQPDEVPPDVLEVIQCTDDLWSSSVAKFARLYDLADIEDDRIRGAFVFAGGSATGRFASYGAQVHNLPRKVLKDAAEARVTMVAGKPIVPAHGKRTSDVLKGMLRPALIPEPGNVFVVADWNAIEARLNPWLSNDPQGNEVLDVFRSGRDLYKREAAGIFGMDAEDVGDESHERQVGKVAVLALGYGGGPGAFASMAKNYGVLLPEAQVEQIVKKWRRLNGWAVRYWDALERAYTMAMRNQGVPCQAGRVSYLFDGRHLWYALPSGRVLCYPFARIDKEGVSYAKAAWIPKSDDKEWPRARLWRGLAAENICQAAGADVLRNSLAQISDVVLHVHDEIVVECDRRSADGYVRLLREVMEEAPEWAPDLPLKVGIKVMERYGK